MRFVVIIAAISTTWLGCSDPAGTTTADAGAGGAGGNMGGAGGNMGGAGGGMGGAGGGQECPDRDRDGAQDARCNANPARGGGDCDDENAFISPNVDEICENMIDNDCDRRVPERDPDCGGSCPDIDRDGYEDAECNPDPRNMGGDCDDTEASVNPGQMERCGNFRDDDCVGGDVRCRQNCEDRDLDGFGEGSGCAGPDCDDTDPQINPWASEVCGDRIDQDCNGQDLTCPEDCVDRDFDGFGQGEGCLGDDCNDRDATINPGAREVPDDMIDQDCNGRDLELAANCLDLDEDGYGDGRGCLAEDCDDSDPRVHRDRAEICGNGIDDDCVGGDRACVRMGVGECVDMDNDGWGEGACRLGSPDCNDDDPQVNPDAREVCNERDDNCNGQVDECPQRNQVCDGAACVGGPGASCRADGECAADQNLVCNEELRQCRVADGEPCMESAQCNPGAECIVLDVCEDDQRCYQAKGGPCEISCDCTGAWLCHEENNTCVECTGDFGCEDPRGTCTDGGFCAEAVEIGGEGNDALDQILHRLIACWGAWAEHNEVEGCDVWLIDDTLSIRDMMVNNIPDEDAQHDDGYVCDEDALGARGFNDNDIEVLDEIFGGCSVVDFNLVEVFWVGALQPGDLKCLYYAPAKSGFGFPNDTRPALVIDECDISRID